MTHRDQALKPLFPFIPAGKHASHFDTPASHPPRSSSRLTIPQIRRAIEGMTDKQVRSSLRPTRSDVPPHNLTNALTSLESALIEKSPVTPLQSALPKSLDLKPFRIRTYEKRWGEGGILELQTRRRHPTPRRLTFDFQLSTVDSLLNLHPKWDVLGAALGGTVASGVPNDPRKTSMPDYDNGGNTRAPDSGLRGLTFRTDHKAIGLRYLWLALFSVFLGMIMSLVMRIHLVWPGAHLPLLSGLDNSPERYAALTLLHGSLMVLMVLTAAPQAGFGNYLLPIQIGARDMAFPTLNLLGFWGTALSLIGVTAAFFLSPETGLNLWISSVALFCAAALANALNFSVTTIDLRAKGMTLPRLPITVWAWFINAILSLLIFSILLTACVYLLADRILGTHFFSTAPFLTALIPFPPSSHPLSGSACSGFLLRHKFTSPSCRASESSRI